MGAFREERIAGPFGGEAPGESRLPTSWLTSVTLDHSPEGFAAHHDLAVGDDGLTVRTALDSDRWRSIEFQWAETDREHVYAVLLRASRPHPIDDELRVLRAFLGRRLTEASSSYYHDGVGDSALTLQMDGSFLSMSTAVREGRPDHRAAAQALWTVLRSAVLGDERAAESVDEAMGQWLGLGYPLGTIAEIDVTTTVDDIVGGEPLLPTATRDGTTVSVRVRHPWFERAALVWKDEPGGALEVVRLNPWDGADMTADMTAVTACLTPLLGEPQEQVVSHVEGERAWTWGGPWDNDHVRVHWGVTIHVRVGSGMPRTQHSWRELLTTLAGCAPDT